jgi:hypothetical protein
MELALSYWRKAICASEAPKGLKDSFGAFGSNSRANRSFLQFKPTDDSKLIKLAHPRRSHPTWYSVYFVTHAL